MPALKISNPVEAFVQMVIYDLARRTYLYLRVHARPRLILRSFLSPVWNTDVERAYEIFEVLQNGKLIRNAAIGGQEDPLRTLCEVAKTSSNEFRLIHLPTKAIIAAVDVRSS